MQEFEMTIESNRRNGLEIASDYFDYLSGSTIEKDGQIFVAEVDGYIVGYSCVWIERRPNELISKLEEYAFVSDVVVLQQYRRRRIGGALLAATEQFALQRGVRTLLLNVLAKNANARGMYEAMKYNAYEVIYRKTM